MKKIILSQTSYIIVIALMSIAVTFSSAMKGPDYSESIVVKVETHKGDISVDVIAPKMCVLKFYIFNSEGRLAKQFYTTGSSKMIVVNLNKGSYIWDVFQNDERIKSGKIELK